MYDNEIKKLSDLHHTRVVTPGESEAIDAAIALMRAAQPKNKAEERARCQYTLDTWYGAEGKDPLEVEWLMRERAAVRAECHIELCCLRKDVADWKQRAEKAEREASEERAEVAGVELAADALMIKLAAAKAEIEQLTLAFQAEQAIASEFDTKLANLRTAAERVWRDPSGANMIDMHDAIEASTKP